MEPETIICKKCGELHRIEIYRGVRCYVCPRANRVILVTNGEQNEKKPDTQRNDPSSS